MIGDRHRDRHVDAHHAHFDRTRELAGGVAVAREDGDAVAILVRRGQFHRFGESSRADDLEHRRSEEHTSELQSLMRISYAVFCLKKKNSTPQKTYLLYVHTE